MIHCRNPTSTSALLCVAMSLPKRARPSRSSSSSSWSSAEKPGKVLSYVVVGGGIAGVSCARELQRHIDSSSDSVRRECGDNSDDTIVITLVSAGGVLKESIGVMKISKFLEELEVYEKSCDRFSLDNPRICIVEGLVVSLDHQSKQLLLHDGRVVPYDKLCLCTGAVPRLLSSTSSKSNIIGIRDTDSVADLLRRLESGPTASRVRKVLIAGNGGIALELVHALLQVENSASVDWLVRDSYAGKAFFDASAAAFVMPSLKRRQGGSESGESSSEPVRLVGTAKTDDGVTEDVNGGSSSAKYGKMSTGAALGPDWLFKSNFVDSIKKYRGKCTGAVNIHFNEDIVAFFDSRLGAWVFIDNKSKLQEGDLKEMIEIANDAITRNQNTMPMNVLTASGTLFSCDFIVSATGVIPSTSYVQPSSEQQHEFFSLDNEGGLIVNRKMQTNIADIFAAGDCCHYTSFDDGLSSNWFQMRLWSQARCMGVYAAHCMLGVEENYGSDYFFEVFAHVTRLFGYKVVLLGRYNCQGLGDELENRVKELVITEKGLVRRDKSEQYAQGSKDSDGGVVDTDVRKSLVMSRSSKKDPSLQLWTRVTAGKEYIKLVVREGRVVGALLVGDTDIEEMVENLILNQLDVSQQGIEILNPDIDIEDYFD